MRRTQCQACPWRDPEAMEVEYPSIVKHAVVFSDNFVCHIRLGGCPGPRLYLKEKAAHASST